MDLKKSTPDSHAVSVGNFAVELLAVPGNGRVLGVTSRGFFLLTGNSRVLFIGADWLFGPAHIVLNVLPEEVKAGLMGAVVDYSPNELIFQNLGFQINLKNAKIWQLPPLPVANLTQAERELQINLITNALVLSGRESRFLPLLKWMAARSPEPDYSDHQLTQFIQTVVNLRQAIRKNKPGKAVIHLDKLLGYGPGLTPSGDDFIWGFLASLNRWKIVICPQFEARSLNESILLRAQKKTSSLSATLIECATRGWMDENMLSVLDTLFTGQGSVKETVEKILAYGSSSGMDALAGMVTVVNSSKK
jgi:hypothetical protein